MDSLILKDGMYDRSRERDEEILEKRTGGGAWDMDSKEEEEAEEEAEEELEDERQRAADPQGHCHGA